MVGKKRNVYEFKKRPWGNRQVLEHLFNEHREALRIFLISKMGYSPDLEDVIQDVFERLANISDLPERLAVEYAGRRAFILKIANNLVVDLARYKKVRVDYLKKEHDLVSDDRNDVTPEREILNQQQLKVVENAIAKLRPAERKVFYLSRFKHLSYKQIAEQMGISPRTVEAHICNALTRVRKAMKKTELST